MLVILCNYRRYRSLRDCNVRCLYSGAFIGSQTPGVSEHWASLFAMFLLDVETLYSMFEALGAIESLDGYNELNARR